MSGFQATLGGGDGIAEELAANQREISIAEFFEKNKHMLGFDSNARAIITAVKEGVDNGLDASEEAGILPDILVEISEDGDYYTLVMEDNGPGIPKSNIPKVFGKLLYGSRFGSMTQSRGQQGIGISAAVLYSQLTSGKPAKITSRPKGREKAIQVELTLDTDTNEPKLQSEEEVEWDRAHGTRIELEMEANMRARSRLYDYIRATAVVNPHARITFDEPNLDEPLVFERGTDDLPQQPEEIRPHPHGVELGHVMKMLQSTDSHSLSGFLQEEFTRVGKKTADDILDNFRDNWYGRGMAWDATLYDGDYADVVTEAVSNKGADSKEEFADGIAERILDAERVSYDNLQAIVNDVAEEVEDGFATTYGSTVRKNTVEALWEVVTEERDADMHRLVNHVTTSRKDKEAVEVLAGVISRRVSQTEKDRATHDDIETFVKAGAERAADRHDETFGDTSRGKIVDAVWDAMTTVSDDVPLVREVKDDRDLASALMDGMQEAKVSRPSTKCLSPITDEKVKAGLQKEYDADFYSATTRDAGVHSGHPFIIEAGIAYGGDIEAEGKIDLLRFANRVPLVYQPGACGITQTVGDIGWRNYKLTQKGGSGLPDGPVVLMVHVASTNVPFTSESKDAMASVPNIEYEIEQAVREVARDLKSYLKKQRSLKKRKRKQNVIADILPSMADKLAATVETDTPDVDGSLAKIMNNVLIKREQDGDEVTVTIDNYLNQQKTFCVTDLVTAKPELTGDDEDVEVVDMDEGEYAVRWRGPVRKNGSVTITYTVDEDAESDLGYTEIEDEKVSIVA